MYTKAHPLEMDSGEDGETIGHDFRMSQDPRSSGAPRSFSQRQCDPMTVISTIIDAMQAAPAAVAVGTIRVQSGPIGSDSSIRTSSLA